MILGMTAFSRSQKQNNNYIIIWEIRSVNNRYLNATFHLSDNFRLLEPYFRKYIKDKILRGKLDCYLKYKNISNDSCVKINEKLLEKVVNLGKDISKRIKIINDLTLNTIFSLSNIVNIYTEDNPNLNRDIIQLFNNTVNKLLELKKFEGKSIRNFIVHKLELLKKNIYIIDTIKESIIESIHARLIKYLNSINISIEKNRIEKEIALIISRSDISEEIHRLKTHIGLILNKIDNEQISGRYLDFLMQEIHREINTLGVKSESIKIIEISIKMKLIVEQIKEQIQNIE